MPCNGNVMNARISVRTWEIYFRVSYNLSVLKIFLQEIPLSYHDLIRNRDFFTASDCVMFCLPPFCFSARNVEFQVDIFRTTEAIRNRTAIYCREYGLLYSARFYAISEQYDSFLSSDVRSGSEYFVRGA